MPREIVVGNGSLAVALDSRMTARDFFFPHVGLENHLLNHRIRTGVWANGKFTWLGDNWDITMKYLPETLVSKCVAKNRELEVELEVNDAVHSFLNIYLRKVKISNVSDEEREVRLFLSHDFHIYGEDAGDTVMYEPILNSMIHYKRRRYFLIDGLSDANQGFFQHAAGYKESFGKEGTWKDAEDGLLSGNPVAQGAVDSVASFKLDMKPQSSSNVYYWAACGKNFKEVEELDTKVRKIGVEQMLLETENYWSAWVNKQEVDLSILPRDVIRLFKTSLAIMRAHVDNDGAIIASLDSDVLHFNRDTYSYVWPRDGALTAIAFDMAGFREASRLFFQFCNRAMTDEGFFNHKYSPDGSVGSSWHALVDAEGKLQLPIQQDETALVLYALWRHYQKHRDLEFIGQVYPNLVLKATEFLLTYKDPETGLPKPSFDMWEEKAGIFTATTATVCAALDAASGFAKVFYDSERQDILGKAANDMKRVMLKQLYDRKLKRFIKAIYPDGFRDTTIDSSLSFIFTCGVFDATDETVVNTMNSVASQLWVNTGIGGVARYENDEYHRVSREVFGNPWFISTLWLARWQIAKASSLDQLQKGLDLLLWVVKRSSRSGVLAEQIDPYTGMPISVSPLVWSHAEFVIATCEYLSKYRQIRSMIST